MKHTLLLITATLLMLPSVAFAQQIRGNVEVETRAFPESALFDEQHASSASFSAEPELYLDWANGDQGFIFTPFARVDLGDAERTHFDIREAYWQQVGYDWELKVGLAKVYWGVTESQHLVDIINQTDLVESPDGEDKLGQPMVHFTWIKDWGTLDAFALPLFRERTFPGEKGRLRFPFIIDTDAADVQERVDLAVRWFHTINIFDVGVSHFWGRSREPRFDLIQQANGAPALVPLYETIHQTGLDVQATVGGWLWKLESITRSGQGERFLAVTGGFEYTFGNLRNSGADLGVLAEYHYDGRDPLALAGQTLQTTPFDDDLFVGARLALNDVQSTDVLGGVVIDRETGGTSLFLEAGRRMGDRWTVDVEVRSFLNTDPADPLHSFRQDNYGQVKLAYHF